MNYGYDNQYSTTNTTYGGQGNSGGGGFMAGGDSSSQGTKRRTESSIRPVTIKQIHDATETSPNSGDFKIDNNDIHQICFVGLVRNITPLSTFTTYKIEDGTGEVEVKFWPDKDSKDAAADAMMDITAEATPTSKKEAVVNGYAKVWGKLGSFNNRQTVTAFVIRPLTDMNEYHFHFLEAVSIHLYFTRGAPPSKQQAGANAVSNAAGVGGAEAGGSGTGPNLTGMSPTAQKLFDTLKNTPQFAEGLHVQNLAAKMNLPTSEVFKAGEELLQQGVIFPTVDDNTWAILEVGGGF